MVELRCESAPVVSNEGFIRLANDLARRLAEGPGAATPDELLAQSSPSNPEQSLRHQLEELFNQVREVFRVVRIARLAGPCGAYVHYNGAVGALLQVEGANAELARDIAMHVAGMAPRVVSRDELDPKCVEKEQQSAIEEARSRGESEKNIPKVVERHLKEFFAQHCLNDQMHVNKERYHGQTVGRLAQAANMKIVRFVRWEVGKE
jgi:elongation factor Ts